MALTSLIGSPVAELSAEIPLLWLSARALGVTAWLLSSATVLFGLALSSGLGVRAMRAGTKAVVHRTLAAMTLLAAVSHVGLLVPDPYAKLTLLDVVIPGLAVTNRWQTAAGTVALLLLLAVSLASLLRARLTRRSWQTIHLAALFVWPLATTHYVLVGSDAMQSWSLAMMTAVAVLLVATIVHRGTTTRPSRVPRRRKTVSYLLRVVGVVPETADATSLLLQVPTDGRQGMRYRSGQFLTLRIPGGESRSGFVARCYSLASSPETHEHLKITVKRTPNGYASNWLCDHARPGLQLEVSRPGGNFTAPEGPASLLLFAGGSGITPIISILRSALVATDCEVTLVYANRDPASIIFAEELWDLAGRYPDRLQLHHWLESRSGRPTQDQVVAKLSAHPGAEVMVCGPKPFADLVRNSAAAAGWPTGRFHVEEFRSLAGDPFVDRAGAAADSDAPAVTAEVELDGRTHVLDWSAESSLVEAMLDAGLDAPYSCLEGACSTCVCTLLAGSVQADSTATGAKGSQSEAKPGRSFLGCQARPESAEVKVKF